MLHPTQALETWQCPGWPVNATDCPTNDMPTVAGLHAVLEKLVRLPPPLATPAQVQLGPPKFRPAFPVIGQRLTTPLRESRLKLW